MEVKMLVKKIQCRLTRHNWRYEILSNNASIDEIIKRRKWCRNCGISEFLLDLKEEAPQLLGQVQGLRDLEQRKKAEAERAKEKSKTT